MKWLSLLLLALVVTTSGIMFADGTIQFVFQIAFFSTLGLSLLLFSLGMFNSS